MIKTEITQKLFRKSIGLTLVLSAAAMAFAQEKHNISGTIVDGQNNPVPYASVSFSHPTNKLFSDATLTDEQGNYNLQLAPGNYTITIEAIDYQKRVISNREISGSGNLGNFSVQQESSATLTPTAEIQGVTITATVNKPYRVEIDKKVYDPSQDVISKGGNLQDVLTNVPSVAVDTDGTVSMRGNSNIRFLINGKPSALLGIDDGADALKSIPADQIDRIEVITNPSAKFEASGTAGILNIILKQNKRVGFNGSVEGSIGYLPQSRLNTNLNWRRGAWTYYVNGGGSYSRNRSINNSTYRSLLDGSQLGNNSSMLSEQNGVNKGENKSFNVTSGFLVDVTDKTSINGSVMFRNFNNESIDQTDFFEQIVRKDTNLPAYPNVPYTIEDEYTTRINDGFRTSNSFQADLGFDQKIGDNGQLITFSTSYQTSKGENNSIANETTNSALGISSLANNILSDNKNQTFLAKADYELPIGENSKFEAGARFDLNNNDYEYFVDQSENGSPFEVLNNFTSTTFYDEKISAAYAQFKSKIGNFGFQTGLRAENTDIDVSFKRITDAEEITVNKKYAGLFPSVFLTYDVGDNSQFLVNYTRRIQRPRSWHLIPFRSYNNNRNLFNGNPDLDPTYENSFELGFSLSKRKITFNPTLYYKKSQDEVNMYQYSGLNSEGATVIFTMPVNAGSEEQYGLDLNLTYDPFNWWRIMSNIDLFGYNNTGEYEGFSFTGDGFSTRIRLTNSFKPNKNTSFQIQGFYRGGEKTASMHRHDMYVVNFGATRTIWDGNGTIAFNIQDIFSTRAMERTAMTPTYTQHNFSQWQPRQFTLSLTYRFRQGEKVEQPRRKRDTNTDFGGDDDMPPM